MQKLDMPLRASYSLNNHQAGIYLIYLFSKKQNEKLNKIPTNTPAKTFYQTIEIIN